MGYVSEYNYAELTEWFGKQYYIPYTTHEKEQKRNTAMTPPSPLLSGTTRACASPLRIIQSDATGYGFTRQFKVYEA
ncbi:hypothetical protein [Lactobacillus kullabergensis]|uniref:hypothetical protein n=1 Tax=Lactobacillus kullabergensis TaxID=1218493 RepID=UPI000AA6BA8B|nr:hypothetical protein [Lactobacillus kullabergensis]